MSNMEYHTSIHQMPVHAGGDRRFNLVGGTVEVLLGITAIVLSILALAGLESVPLTSIAVIATGAGLAFEGGAIARTATAQTDRTIAAGIGADSVGGIAAVALGILSLLGLDRTVLLPVASIALGAGMLVASGVMSVEREREHRFEEHIRATGAAGIRTLVGAGAMVLGILGLVGQPPITMTLISMLAIGGGLLLSGASFGARLATIGHSTYTTDPR
jgi:hypothetical protein